MKANTILILLAALALAGCDGNRNNKTGGPGGKESGNGGYNDPTRDGVEGGNQLPAAGG